jgi:hypothetical protein
MLHSRCTSRVWVITRPYTVQRSGRDLPRLGDVLRPPVSAGPSVRVKDKTNGSSRPVTGRAWHGGRPVE